MRRIKEDDNIMGKVMAKTDNYDGLFKTELAKYDKAREAIATNVSSQADILSRLRATHARFTQMYDVDAWRAATDAHASSVRAAVAHYRELSSGLEQGLTFYSGFAEAVNRLAGECEGFVENRRREKAQLEGVVARRAEQAAAVAHHQAAATAAQQNAAADQAAAQKGYGRGAGVRGGSADQEHVDVCAPSRAGPAAGHRRRGSPIAARVLLAAATPRVRLPSSAARVPLGTAGVPSSAAGVPSSCELSAAAARSRTSIRWLPVI